MTQSSLINARVFELMKSRVPVRYHERFLNFMARSIKEVKIVNFATVDELYGMWVEAVTKETKERKMLGEDY